MDIEPHVQDEAEGMRAAKASFGDAHSCMTACGASSVEPNFRIDDLLNFPSESVEDQFCEDASDGLFTNPPFLLHDLPNFKGGDSFPPGDGLCVPPDELILQLEWLSSFNEDNFFTASDAKFLSLVPSSSRASCVSLSGCAEIPATTTRRKPVETFNSHSPVSVLEPDSQSYAGSCGLNQVFKSCRFRKARAGRRIWSLDILKPVRSNNRIKGSIESASLHMTSNTSAYSEPFCSLLQQDALEKPFKKAKLFNVDAGPGQAMRRCTHCFVEKTPQWRAGPQGSKTLCNACGMRYKLGRLVPEYRPAASPTFSNEVHSNSHRRILEMRRTKAGELFGKFIEKSVECEKEGHSMDAKLGYDLLMAARASGERMKTRVEGSI